VTKDAAGTVIGTLGIKKATLNFIAGEEVDTGELDLSWTTGAAEFEGTFSVAASLWDKSGYQRIPAATTFSGALRTIEAGVATEFLSGTLALTPGGYAAFDSTLPDSATNFYSRNIAFTGTITAPRRPVLALTLATSNTSFDDQPKTATLRIEAAVETQAGFGALAALGWQRHIGAADLTLRWHVHERRLTVGVAWQGLTVRFGADRLGAGAHSREFALGYASSW